MESAQIVLYQIAVMFILILLGFFLYKKNIFTRRGCNQLSELVLTVVCPVLIFTSFQKDLEPRLIKGLLISFGLSVVSHAVSIVLGTVLCGKWRGADGAVERFAAAYCFLMACFCCQRDSGLLPSSGLSRRDCRWRALISARSVARYSRSLWARRERSVR